VTAEEWQNPELGVLNPAFLFVVFVIASVEKHILFAGMAVHITIEDNSPLPIQVADHLLAVVDSFVEVFIWLQPFAVQVTAKQRAPIVALDYAVRVQHRHYFENEMFA